MRTLAKRLKKEQRKNRMIKKESAAALHQAEMQKRMRERAELENEMLKRLVAVLLVRITGGSTLEIDGKELCKNERKVVARRKEDGMVEIRVEWKERE